jgi:hypothetical protein
MKNKLSLIFVLLLLSFTLQSEEEGRSQLGTCGAIDPTNQNMNNLCEDYDEKQLKCEELSSKCVWKAVANTCEAKNKSKKDEVELCEEHDENEIECKLKQDICNWAIKSN